MILRKYCFLAVVMVIGFVFQSCVDNETSIDNTNTSRVQLKLVDAPGDYLNVNIEIIDIQYRSSEDEGGWTSFTPDGGYPINVDLTELIAGNSLIIADEVLPSGMLSQVRLVLSDNNTLVIENEDESPSELIHLDTPSSQQSGLKLKLDTELESGFSYTFVLDWDVQKSIVKAGNSEKYNLKPVINVIAEVNSGSIAGNVVGKSNSNDENAVAISGVLVEAYLGGEYITSSTTDVNGDFIIQGLKPTDSDLYVLKIEHDGFEDYMTVEENEIAVVAGEITILGESIELLLPKSISGNVKDVDGVLGSVMVNVYLSSMPDDSVGIAQTDAEGNFFFRGLDTETYILKIVHTGYDNYTSSDISVTIGQLTEIASIELSKTP